MKEEKRRLLAKIAYMHYVEGKSQTEIAKETNIYRTTVCRMLTQAKSEGIVCIEISDFNPNLYALEEEVKKKYGLESIEIIAKQSDDTVEDLLLKIAKSSANLVKNIVKDGNQIGLSWGSTISKVIDQLDQRVLKDVMISPLAGGPSTSNASYHVNTLVYRLARIFHGKSTFINAMVVQENEDIAKGIVQSKYFKNILASWENLDLAIVGIGAEPNRNMESQWRDLLSKNDFNDLKKADAVGEICCRFFDDKGNPVCDHLQNRIIAIPLEQLAKVPNSIGVASGEEKAQAILAALKSKVINHLVTDEQTILKVLELDK